MSLIRWLNSPQETMSQVYGSGMLGAPQSYWKVDPGDIRQAFNAEYVASLIQKDRSSVTTGWATWVRAALAAMGYYRGPNGENPKRLDWNTDDADNKDGTSLLGLGYYAHQKFDPVVSKVCNARGDKSTLIKGSVQLSDCSVPLLPLLRQMEKDLKSGFVRNPPLAGPFRWGWDASKNVWSKAAAGNAFPGIPLACGSDSRIDPAARVCVPCAAGEKQDPSDPTRCVSAAAPITPPVPPIDVPAATECPCPAGKYCIDKKCLTPPFPVPVNGCPGGLTNVKGFCVPLCPGETTRYDIQTGTCAPCGKNEKRDPSDPTKCVKVKAKTTAASSDAGLFLLGIGAVALLALTLKGKGGQALGGGRG